MVFNENPTHFIPVFNQMVAPYDSLYTNFDK